MLQERKIYCCRRVRASFSPEILQAVAVKGLSFLFLGVQSVQIFALYARFRLCPNALRVSPLGRSKATWILFGSWENWTILRMTTQLKTESVLQIPGWRVLIFRNTAVRSAFSVARSERKTDFIEETENVHIIAKGGRVVAPYTVSFLSKCRISSE